MPSDGVQQRAKERGKDESTQDRSSPPAYRADPPADTVKPPAQMDGPPAFMARRRVATFFTPDGRKNFVIEHLNLDPLTAAEYEQAIENATHMIRKHGHGELYPTSQYMLDYWVAKERGGNPGRVKPVNISVMVPQNYLIYLEELSKARRRGEIEGEIVALQEKSQQKFVRGLNGIMRSGYMYKIIDLEKELVELQAIGGRKGLNSW
ncbi:hypothetical protein F52700_5177 [Fusarium sp. NRRL 52700]|nr:hypothetical protein F52700_5177 [Fusarium sp. NRRL 52700]